MTVTRLSRKQHASIGIATVIQWLSLMRGNKHAVTAKDHLEKIRNKSDRVNGRTIKRGNRSTWKKQNPR